MSNMPNFRTTARACPPVEEPTSCSKCELTFNTFMAYHQHKLRSRRHITCDVCSQDFESHDACKQHHDLMHSHEQDLNCPGCGNHFTRVGGLMSHIELTECRGFARERLELARKEKKAWHANYQNARKFRDYGRTSGEFTDLGPSPFMVKTGRSISGAGVAADGIIEGTEEDQVIESPVQIPPRFEGDNILAFDDPSEALNLPWGETAQPTNRVPKFDQTTDFPLLSTKAGNIVNTPAFGANIWATGQKLFVNGPPAVSSPAELRQSLNVQEEDEDPLDPDSHLFKPKKYYLDLTQKYKCPRRGCSKSSPNEFAFIQHLKSPAHRNEKLQCMSCLRYFSTATALTQHIESQGVRCKVRNTEGFNGVVDGVTGGTAVTTGRHIDDTIKYTVNPCLRNLFGAQGAIEAHKAAATEKDEKFNNYWETQTPTW